MEVSYSSVGGSFSVLHPSIAEQVSERTGAVKGAPHFGAASATLDGEDRSETIVAEGKGHPIHCNENCLGLGAEE